MPTEFLEDVKLLGPTRIQWSEKSPPGNTEGKRSKAAMSWIFVDSRKFCTIQEVHRQASALRTKKVVK